MTRDRGRMPGDRGDMIAGNDDRPYASRDSAPPEGRVGRRPMWLVARTRANERDAVQQALRLTQLEFGSEVGVEGASGFACGLVLAASSLNGGTGQSVLASEVRLASQDPSARCCNRFLRSATN